MLHIPCLLSFIHHDMIGCSIFTTYLLLSIHRSCGHSNATVQAAARRSQCAELGEGWEVEDIVGGTLLDKKTQRNI